MYWLFVYSTKLSIEFLRIFNAFFVFFQPAIKLYWIKIAASVRAICIIMGNMKLFLTLDYDITVISGEIHYFKLYSSVSVGLRAL